MLYEIFLAVLKMSAAATLTAVVITLVKYLLQKLGCPRRITVLLWIAVALRLICPAMPASNVSFFNVFERESRKEAVYEKDSSYELYDVTYYKNESKAEAKKTESGTRIENYAAVLWAAGALIVLTSGAVSYIKMKRKLKFAVKQEKNIYISDSIQTPFVFGVVFPKIYIPRDISERCMSDVIMHERTHIKRGDHISKLAAYILLALHWFNPAVWLMFKLFSEDVEIACDEAVLEKIGFENKKAYLNSVLMSACGARKTTYIYNVCFSENPTKKRIKCVAETKKRSKFFCTVFLIICVVTAIPFVTNAVELKSENGTAEKSHTNISEVDISGLKIGESAVVYDIKDEKAPENPTAETENTEVAPTADNAAVYEEPVPERQSVKSQTASEDLYAGFEKLSFKSIDLNKILSELSYGGAKEAEGTEAELGKSFLLGQYGEYGKERVKCDVNGNISLYFDLNSDSLVNVNFYDSETGEEVGGYKILADSESVYSFLGFEKEKSYDVVITDKAKSDWEIGGQYIIY